MLVMHVVEVVQAVFLNIKLGRLSSSLLVSLMVVAACR